MNVHFKPFIPFPFLTLVLMAVLLCPVWAGEPQYASEPPPLDLSAPAPTPTPTPEAPQPVERTAAATPSQSVTLNLINRLVQRGVLTKEDASDLIKMAEQDAANAQAQAQGQAQEAPAPDDTVRVTYVPEMVKNQMVEEIQQKVMTQAVEEKWAAPRTFPEWATRFRFNGDVRVRGQGDFFPSGNVVGNGSSFWNYNSINSGSPFDYTNTSVNPPFSNVDQDRTRARLRARFGVEVELGNGFTSGFRIATGESSSPVSQNQSLGGGNGNFSKYAIWLDRGFIQYERGTRDKNVSVTLGRFENPFFASSMIWSDDLGFDGMAVKGKYKVNDGLTPFFAGGIFPVYNTDFNFSSNQNTKFKSQDKWLYGAQMGTEVGLTKDLSAKVAGAFYDFQHIDGRVSTPYTPLTSADAGSTDTSRPLFAQKGNTYIALRNILPDSSNSFGTTNQWQYFGLATPYRIAAFTTRLDLSSFDPLHLWFLGEVVKNVAFDKNKINNNGPSNLKGAVNNNGTGSGNFEGGDLGWFIRLNLGNPSLDKQWDWNVFLGYRYVESDAVVDGFADSDFGGGGTNVKGYTLGGNLALSPRVYTGFKWMSADAIAGPTFKEDVLQLDLNAKF
jgi:hypothetical protein